MTEENNNKQEVLEEQKQMPRPSGFALLLSLFLRPAFGLMAAQIHRCWVPALFMIFLIIMSGSVIKSFSMYKKYSGTVEEIVKTVGHDMGPIAFINGTLKWSDNVKLPYSNVIGDWRIDFQETDGKPAFNEPLDAMTPHGVVISHDSVSVWTRDVPGKGDFNQEVIMKPKHFRMFEQSLAKEGKSEMDLKYMLNLGKMLCFLFIPFVAIWQALCFSSSIIFCVTVFSLCLLFFRRDTRHSISDLLIMAVNCCVPPCLMSFAWYAAAPASWNFQTVFFVAFVLYLIFVFFDINAFNKSEQT